jgi:hypothetical protein
MSFYIEVVDGRSVGVPMDSANLEQERGVDLSSPEDSGYYPIDTAVWNNPFELGLYEVEIGNTYGVVDGRWLVIRNKALLMGDDLKVRQDEVEKMFVDALEGSIAMAKEYKSKETNLSNLSSWEDYITTLTSYTFDRDEINPELPRLPQSLVDSILSKNP